MFNKTDNTMIKEVEEDTSFVRGKFPIIYLGCPIIHAKMKTSNFYELIKKVQNNMQV